MILRSGDSFIRLIEMLFIKLFDRCSLSRLLVFFDPDINFVSKSFLDH